MTGASLRMIAAMPVKTVGALSSDTGMFYGEASVRKRSTFAN